MVGRIAILFVMIAGPVAYSGAAAPEIGSPAPPMTFKDIRYLPRTLDELGGQTAIVLVITALDVPDRPDVDRRLKQLHRTYAGRHVTIATLNVAPDDTILRIAHHVLEQELPVTPLRDLDGIAARALGVQKLGTAVILTGTDHVIRYRGDLGGVPSALDALLAGEQIQPSERPVDGPSMPVREVPETAGTVTYSQHIAPIMNAHCVSCHRQGETAPFSLLNYNQVASRADMIREVVLEERMPPWYGVRAHGPFANERGVTQVEKTSLLQWLAAGKPEGDPALMPAAPTFSDSEWAIAEPDLILSATEEEAIPADGYIPYRYITFPYQFPEDTWVQGIEILPGNPEVVHHANLIYTQVGEQYREQHGFLTGKVPGGSPVDLQGPVGMMIPKDAVLTLQVHYVTTGQPETDRMRVGIRYARGTIVKQTHHQRIRPDNIAIPPGEAFHRISAEETIDDNATVLALFTHMHLRGRDMTFYADYPDGTTETLLAVPNYSFDWQLAYEYAPGTKRFPKGTEIRTVSHYDNSAFNPYNPDPAVEVEYGDQTYHEMNDGYIFYLDEDEFLNLEIDPETGQARD